MLLQGAVSGQPQGDGLGRANALTTLGFVRKLPDAYSGGPGSFSRPWLYRNIGDQGGEITALDEIGALHRSEGLLPRCIALAARHERTFLETSRARSLTDRRAAGAAVAVS
jgi:hypothetical protein